MSTYKTIKQLWDENGQTPGMKITNANWAGIDYFQVQGMSPNGEAYGFFKAGGAYHFETVAKPHWKIYETLNVRKV